VAHAERALGRLARDRERLGEQQLKILAALQALAELDGLGRKLLVGERLESGLELVHAADERLVGAKLLALTHGEELLQDVHGVKEPL